MLTVALIGAGVLSLRQAVSIVLGANIGTTITAQIIRLMDIDSNGNMVLEFCKPENLAPIALVVGIILIMFVKRKSVKTVGDIFIGFGILFSGLLNMTAAVNPLSDSPEFAAVLARFAGNPLLGILSGLVLTVVVQSSSAMVGMLQALSSTGAMTSLHGLSRHHGHQPGHLRHHRHGLLHRLQQGRQAHRRGPYCL